MKNPRAVQKLLQDQHPKVPIPVKFTQKRNDEIYLLAALERGSPSQGGEGTGPHPFVKPLVFSFSFVLGVCSSTPTRRLVAL